MHADATDRAACARPSLADARQFLAGNPVYEAGGAVELRELPRS